MLIVFSFSDPGCVEAQAAGVPFEDADLSIFAPLMVPEGATERAGTDRETSGYPTGQGEFSCVLLGRLTFDGIAKRKGRSCSPNDPATDEARRRRLRFVSAGWRASP